MPQNYFFVGPFDQHSQSIYHNRKLQYKLDDIHSFAATTIPGVGSIVITGGEYSNSTKSRLITSYTVVNSTHNREGDVTQLHHLNITRSRHTAVAFGPLMHLHCSGCDDMCRYVFGGKTDNGVVTDNIERKNLVSYKEMKNATMKTPRYDHVSVLEDGIKIKFALFILAEKIKRANLIFIGWIYHIGGRDHEDKILSTIEGYDIYENAPIGTAQSLD